MEAYLAPVQSAAGVAFGWPSWVTNIVAVLCTCIALLGTLQLDLGSLVSTVAAVEADAKPGATWRFRKFQLSYLVVYLLIMLADWLQGTNMYTLYSSYGVNVGFLFLTGFLTSAVFGSFIGGYVDRWGRRCGCIVFCLLEIVINVMEHVPSLPVLFVGRILGGISTNLLFSAFEAWMVSEHRKMGFSETSLVSTFAIASWGNGVMAIVAGFIAQWSVTGLGMGDIGPFQMAIALTVLCLVLIVLWWGENYGGDGSGGGGGGGGGGAEHEPTAAKAAADEKDAKKRPSPNASRGRASSRVRGRKTPTTDAADGGDDDGTTTPSRGRKGGRGSRASTPASSRAGSKSPSRRSSRRLSGRGAADAGGGNATANGSSGGGGQRPQRGATTASSDASAGLKAPEQVPMSDAAAGATGAGEDVNIFALLWHQPEILLLGFSQACFEGAVYSFVFMWVPVLIDIYPAYIAETASVASSADALTVLPTGLVFSCFMLAMTLGGMLFSALLGAMVGSAAGAGEDDVSTETRCLNRLCVGIYVVSAAAMAIPALYPADFTKLMACFLVLEAMVGMFNAGSGTLRSVYYIEAHQSSIISVFRIPLNLLVVCGTVLTSDKGVRNEVVFAVLAGVHCVAALLQVVLCSYGGKTGGGSGAAKQVK